jgi:16S rRNA (guanine527-N7)-methyltransferase
VRSKEFREELLDRTVSAGIALTTEEIRQLELYFRLLAKWNARTNLTALPLTPPTAETFDRLLIEPLVAANHVPGAALTWFDVGSGGGSPALPLKIVRPALRLTMIESKARKAAFLREAVRSVGLSEAVVENDRLEGVARRCGAHRVDLITVRAVRLAGELVNMIHALLALDGRLLLFHSPGHEFPHLRRFSLLDSLTLHTRTDARLSIFRPTFHVEQKD